MRKILLVDDMAICREPVAASLRSCGFDVRSVSSGPQALAQVVSEKPDLILLDLVMPGMSGLDVLQRLRADTSSRRIPVILMTDSSARDHVVQAKELGVQDYYLKSEFSIEGIRERIERHLPQVGGDSRDDRVGANRTTKGHAGRRTPAMSCSPDESATSPSPKKLLTHDEIVRRVQNESQIKTLAGVVADVIGVASTRDASPTEMAQVLGKDPVLSSRVIHLANSAALGATSRSSTIEEAVRSLGFARIRDLAMSIGIFDSLPSDGKDGFNVLRCWQHSMAVADVLSHHFARQDRSSSGVVQLVGLCEGLPEMVLRQLFPEEFATAVAQAAETGQPHARIVGRVFGVPMSKLASLVLNRMGLPAAAIHPIVEYVKGEEGKAARLSPLAAALREASLYANGMLLASSASAPVGPVSKESFQRAFGDGDPEGLDWELLRNRVLMTTNLLAKLNPDETAKLSEPMFPPGGGSVWYARHSLFSEFDPLEVALSSLSAPRTHETLPTEADQFSDCGAIIIAIPKVETPGFMWSDMERVADLAPNVPLLCLVDRMSSSESVPESVRVVPGHVSLSLLNGFLSFE